MYARFGPSKLDNYTGELVKLQQSGTVLDHQMQFEILLSKTRGVTLEQRVSFVYGLQDSLRSSVQICQPQTLHAQ